MANTITNSEKKKGRAGDVPPEVKTIVDNDKLTDQEQLFCLLYVKCFNAQKAYTKAFGCQNVSEANRLGGNLMKRKAIASEIKRLKKERFTKMFIDEDDVLQKHIDIAHADITDIIEFGTDEEKNNFMRLRDSNIVDGSTIAEVRFSKNGNIDIRMVDKQKSLCWLSDHFGQLDEEKKARLEKLRAEVSAMTDKGDGESGVIVIPAVLPTKEKKNGKT